MQADGFSLDDKRTPQPDTSDLADILARWRNREAEGKRARTDQSFLVPKAEIADNDYDLSINRYKDRWSTRRWSSTHRSTILKRLAQIGSGDRQGSVMEVERGCWDEVADRLGSRSATP